MQQQTTATWRTNLVFGVLLVAAAALSIRLGLLVHRGADRALSMVQRQSRMVLPLPGRPGNIFARAGQSYVLLASSEQVPSCFADPFLLEDDEISDVAVAVGDTLQMDPLEVQNILIGRRQERFAWIRRELTPAQAEAIRRLGLPAIGLLPEWRRRYPNGSLAATLVGFRRLDGEPGSGLELSARGYLTPVDGRRVVLADARRRAIWPVPEDSRLPHDGDHVFLTIDTVIQAALQEAVSESVETFGAKWGVGVVIDPQTGYVLAMCSVPTYDPNAYNRAAPANFTNRAISVPYEPGSVAKPLFAAAAVDAGVVDYSTKIFCENGAYVAPRGGRITDHGHQYGWLTLADGVVHSSNICLAKTGEKLGNTNLYAAAVGDFHHGAATDDGLRLAGQWGGAAEAAGH